MLLPVENCAEIATIFTSFAALLLTSHVAELARRKKSDFTRSKAGKLPLNKLLVYIIFRNSKDTSSELSKFFSSIGENRKKPSRQAANKRLHRLNYNVWPYLSQEFAKLFYASKTLVRTLKGYLVLAGDSSAIEMPYSPEAAALFGFHKSNHVKTASDSAKILARCGGLYDVINHFYVDYCIKPFADSEISILKDQLKAFAPVLAHRKAIILGDRGYISLTIMALAQKLGYKFCIRAKRSTYKAEVARMNSDDENIQIKLQRTVFSRITDPEALAYLANATYFTVRVVKNYWTNPKTGARELTIYFTNLPKDEFSASEIISLYEKRWSIELAYRTLKVVLELERPVSLDPYIAVNTIYGKIMYYDFCAIFREQLETFLPEDDQRISKKSGKQRKKRKYPRQISAKNLVEQLYAENLAKCLFPDNDIHGLIQDICIDLETMLNKLSASIKKGRHYTRWGKRVTSSYRYKFSIDGRNHPKVALVNGAMRTVRP